jgi:hypothetical protein
MQWIIYLWQVYIVYVLSYIPLTGINGLGMMFWKGAACFKSQTSSCVWKKTKQNSLFSIIAVYLNTEYCKNSFYEL